MHEKAITDLTARVRKSPFLPAYRRPTADPIINAGKPPYRFEVGGHFEIVAGTGGAELIVAQIDLSGFAVSKNRRSAYE